MTKKILFIALVTTGLLVMLNVPKVRSDIVNPTNGEQVTPQNFSPGTRKIPQLNNIEDGRNVPVNLSAVVLDNQNKRVPGVKIKYEVRRWKINLFAGPPAAFENYEVSTDSFGNALINQGSGDSLTITALEKLSYKADEGSLRMLTLSRPEQGGGREALLTLRVWPDGQRPVPIAKGTFGREFPPDGETHSMVVSNKQGRALGTMEVMVRRHGQLDSLHRSPYEFRVSLIGAELKLQKDAHESLEILPNNGFAPFFDFRSEEKPSRITTTHRFYFRRITNNVWGNFVLTMNPSSLKNTAILRVDFTCYEGNGSAR